MSVSTEKATLQVTFQKEKLEALRFYMQEKNLVVEDELQNHMNKIYEKHVPVPTRRYLERNSSEQEVQPESTTNTPTRGRKRAERAQPEQEQSEVESGGDQSQEQTQEEDQGMTMSM